MIDRVIVSGLGLSHRMALLRLKELLDGCPGVDFGSPLPLRPQIKIYIQFLFGLSHPQART